MSYTAKAVAALEVAAEKTKYLDGKQASDAHVEIARQYIILEALDRGLIPEGFVRADRSIKPAGWE